MCLPIAPQLYYYDIVKNVIVNIFQIMKSQTALTVQSWGHCNLNAHKLKYYVDTLVPQLSLFAVQIVLLILQGTMAVVEDWEQGYCADTSDHLLVH